MHYSVSQKKSPRRFSDIFSLIGWEILISFFTHLLYVHIYARLKMFFRKRLNACVSADGGHFEHIT